MMKWGPEQSFQRSPGLTTPRKSIGSAYLNVKVKEKKRAELSSLLINLSVAIARDVVQINYECGVMRLAAQIRQVQITCSPIVEGVMQGAL